MQEWLYAATLGSSSATPRIKNYNHTQNPMPHYRLQLLAPTRLHCTVGLLCAGWPNLRWYALRLNDGSDEPLGLLALLVAVVFAARASLFELIPRRSLTLICAGLCVYLAAYPWLPPLARALWFIPLLALAAAPRGFAFAWTTLLALSLPLISSLQFYLGYPLRLATTQLSVALLNLFGQRVEAQATTMLWAGERVIVDAPCSGIQMAWSGLFLAAVLACWRRLPTRDALRLFRITGALVFIANLLRATALFLMGTGQWRLPAFAHEGIGLALFAITAVLICTLRLPCPRPHSA